MSDGEVAREALDRWRTDFPRLVRDLFAVTPDPWQDRALEAFNGPVPRTAMRASKGPGKSCVEAWCVWGFLLTRDHPKVAATSVTFDNLRDGLWTELAKWRARSPLLQRLFDWTAERVVLRSAPETWWAAARSWSRSATIEQMGQTLAGLHADNILFVVDEVGSVPDPVVKTAEAALANIGPGCEGRLLIGGNPERTEGALFRACTSEQGSWNLITVSGDPDDPDRSPRVSIEWARDMIRRYGRDDPWVRTNILGLFPLAQANKLIGLDLAHQATQRHYPVHAEQSSPVVIGVDVARFGDDRSAIAVRQGLVLRSISPHRGLDLMTLSSLVAAEINARRPAATFVDVTGLGAGVVDRLRQLGFYVIPVEFGGRAMDQERFANKRAEIWSLMAEWLKDGGALPENPELLADLTAPTYSYNMSGRLVMESKDDLRKRGISSPDLADAVATTFASPVAPIVEDRRDLARQRDADLDYNPLEAPFGVRDGSALDYSPIGG